MFLGCFTHKLLQLIFGLSNQGWLLKMFIFQFILEKIQKKNVAYGKQISFSQQGEAIIQNSSDLILNYYTQCIAILDSTCDKIDKEHINFLWDSSKNKKKIRPVNWTEVTRPKRYGGLALRKASHVNIISLAKLNWRQRKKKHLVWVQCVSHYVDKEGSKKNINFLLKSTQGSINYRAFK